MFLKSSSSSSFRAAVVLSAAMTAPLVFLSGSTLPGGVSAFGGAQQTTPPPLRPVAPRRPRRRIAAPAAGGTVLFGNSENIRAAMEATERCGINSPEARLAWEIVEEFDASSNDDAAYAVDADRGLSPERLAEAYADVGRSMEVVRSRRGGAAAGSLHRGGGDDGGDDDGALMRDVAAELGAIRLSPPEGRPAMKIPGLWDSKLRARAVTERLGVGSAEARLAWEEVEEIAASGLETAVGGGGNGEGGADPVQAAHACMALEELDRFLRGGRHRSGGDDDDDLDARADAIRDDRAVRDYEYVHGIDPAAAADAADDAAAGYTEGYDDRDFQNGNHPNHYHDDDGSYNYYGENNNDAGKGGGGGTYH